MLFTVAIAVIGFFILFGALLYFGQGRVIFQPTSKLENTPEQFDLEYEDISIVVERGERIHGWYFSAEQAEQTVLFCHGNAGNISHRLETARFLLKLGVNALLFDYRGYGQSDGSPTEANLYLDAEKAYAWLVEEKQAAPQTIYLFGRSLGGAVATDLATRVDCAGLIVESSFTSSADMGQRMYPFMPIRILVRYRFDSLGKIGRVNCPVLIAHSPDDEMIPYEMGQDLFDAAGEDKHFLKFRGGHNTLAYFETETYRQVLQAFLTGGPISDRAADQAPEDG